MLRTFWKVLLAVLLLGVFPLTRANAQASIEQWYRWEWTLRSTRDYQFNDNPYRKLILRVHYEPVAGTCTNSPWCQGFDGYGYWDGGRFYKIRSAFPQGTWNWSVTCQGISNGLDCSTDPELDSVLGGGQTTTTATGTVTVVNNVIQDDPLKPDRYDLLERGFVRMSTNTVGPKYLTYGDGTSVFYWRADTAWGAVIEDAKDGDTSNTRWTQFLDDRRNKGFTVILMSIAPNADRTQEASESATYLFDDVPAGATCTGAAYPKSCSRWKPAGLWPKLDDKIRLANERGFLVVLVDVMDPQANKSNNDADLKYPDSGDAAIFARNLAARLSGSHVIFSPSFDDPLKNSQNVSFVPLMDAVGNALRDAAPRHLVTAHLAGGSSICDYYQIHARPWHQLHVFQSGHAFSSNGCNGNEDTYECAMRKARVHPDQLSPTPAEPFTGTCAFAAPTSTNYKPVANGEGAYDDTYWKSSQPTTQVVDTPYGVRHSGYVSALNGAFGVSLGIGGPEPTSTDKRKLYAWTLTTDAEWTAAFGATGGQHMKILGDQLDLQPWQMLQRRSSRIKNQPLDDEQDKKMVLAATSDANFAAIYMPDDAEIRFDGTFLNGFDCTNTGTWSVTWVNPKTNDTTTAGTCANISDATGATRKLTRPACANAGTSGPIGGCDWLVKLARIGFYGLTSGLEVWPAPTEDGTGWRIVGNLKGSPKDKAFTIAQTTNSKRLKLPVTAGDGAGNSIVAWETEDDGDLHGIFLRRVDGQGRMLDHEYPVNLTKAYDQTNPWVALDPSGRGGLITWTSYGQDGDLGGIFARRINPAGVPFGREIPVNVNTAGRQDFSKALTTPQGRTFVAWTSDGQDGEGEGVYARWLDDKGDPIGAEIRVNTTTAGAQWLSSLDLEGTGILVTWTSYDGEGRELGIWGQRYGFDGTPVGGEQLVVPPPSPGV